MEKIKELVGVVNRIKSQRIEVIGKGKSKRGQLIKALYDGIATGKYETDEQAAEDLYGANYNFTNYTTLKNRLQNQLLNSIFFINLSDYHLTDFQQAYIEARKTSAIIQILLGRTSRKTSIDLAEKLIRKSLKYQFTEINLDLARILRRHYRIFEHDMPKSKKYDQIVEEQLAILTAETEIENLYELAVQGLGNKRSSRIELAEKAKTYIPKAKAITQKYDSIKIGQFSHLLFVLAPELANNYKGIEKACLAAIQYYDAKGELNSKEKSLIFYIKLLAAYIPLKKFKEGETIATKILTAITPGSFNWFLAIEHYFLLSLHTGNYQRGNELFLQATTDKGFKKLMPDYSEIWLVYGAYIEYLKISGLLERDGNKTFRVARFMNQVPVFSKDKRGINISILIVHILILIAQGKETKVIDKVEALRTYVYTHLRNDESLRSNCFIKMLLRMVEAKFHRNATIRKTKLLRKKLESAPIGTKGFSQYVEIIPYEKLWEISLGYLSNRAF